MQLGDHAERAESPDVELGEVVTGHVLHHARAGADQAAVPGCDGRAEGCDRAPVRSRAGAARPFPSRRPSRCSAPAAPADRARATCRLRRAGGGRRRYRAPAWTVATRSAGLTDTISASPRVDSARSAGASAASQVPWPSRRMRHPSSWASPQTAAIASGAVRSGAWQARRDRARAGPAPSSIRSLLELYAAHRDAFPARHRGRVWTGNTLPGSTGPSVLNTPRTVAHRLQCRGIEQTERHVVALVRRPTPCSPVMLPPAPTHTSMISRLASCTRSASA